MRFILDGLYILNIYKSGMLVITLSGFGIGIWGKRFFHTADQKCLAQILSFSLCFGALSLIPLSFALVLLGRIWNPILKFGSLLVAPLGFVILINWIRKYWVVKIKSNSILFCIIVIVTLLTRLAFLNGIILPPYDDSPEHYMIVQNLLAPNGSPDTFYSIETLLSRYYHLGFHSLAAWFSSASYLDTADSIALLGQLFVVILPISVFLLVICATNNLTAGFVAMGLAAFAWRMPAFASNWGKYPAIAGISLFPAVVGIWTLYWRDPGRKTSATVILLIATVALIFVHSRLAVCLVMVFISFLLTQKILPVIKMDLLKASLLALLAAATFLGLWDYLVVFFGNGYYLVIGLVILLLPFGFYHTPQLVVSVMLFDAGIWILSHVPVFIRGYDTALLDKPFIEIILCIPLSVLGGAGFVGFLDQLQKTALRRLAYVTLATILAFSFVSANSVYPDRCCNYVTNSDIQAIQWLEENTSPSMIIWIPAFKNGNYMIATDAGTWIHPLTGRNTNKQYFNFDWSSHNSREILCRPEYNDVYIYKGGSLYSFVDEIIAEQTWLTPVFTSGETKIYKINDACNHKSLE